MDCPPYGTADGAVDRSFICLTTAFTMVHAPCRPLDISRFLLLLVVNGFHHGLRTVLLSGCLRIAHSFARQWLLRFARCISQRMAADCSFLHSLTAFPTVCMPISSADGSRLFVLPRVNFFYGLQAVLLRGSQWIANTSARHRLPR